MDLHPTHPSFRFELGRALTLLQQTRAAVHHLVRGIRLHPGDERGHRVVADILLERRHPLLARRVLERGLRHAPDSELLREVWTPRPPSDPERALIQQVNGLLQGNRGREALRLLREAATQGPLTVGLKLLEAEACEAVLPPELGRARRAYEEAIALAPTWWMGYSDMGLFILRRGGPRELPHAIQLLEEARRQNPARPEPVLNLALASLKGGRHAEAVSLATRLVQGLPPPHPIAVQAQQLIASQE